MTRQPNDHASPDLAYNKGVLAKALIFEITWSATEIDKKYTLSKAAEHGMYVHSSKAFPAYSLFSILGSGQQKNNNLIK